MSFPGQWRQSSQCALQSGSSWLCPASYLTLPQAPFCTALMTDPSETSKGFISNSQNHTELFIIVLQNITFILFFLHSNTLTRVYSILVTGTMLKLSESTNLQGLVVDTICKWICPHAHIEVSVTEPLHRLIHIGDCTQSYLQQQETKVHANHRCLSQPDGHWKKTQLFRALNCFS